MVARKGKTLKIWIVGWRADASSYRVDKCFLMEMKINWLRVYLEEKFVKTVEFMDILIFRHLTNHYLRAASFIYLQSLKPATLSWHKSFLVAF